VIVVDTNVIQYCWVNGQHTTLAQAARRRDSEWHAPVLWQSELRNVLLAYLRRGLLTRDEGNAVMKSARKALAPASHVLDDELVLRTALDSGLTAYDAEFVVLAHQLRAPLVTEDRAVLKAFPDEAVSLRQFVQAG